VIAKPAFLNAPFSAARIALPVAVAAFGFSIALYVAVTNYPVGLLAAFGIALAPAMIAAAWKYPLIFPYGAYAILVPFDLLLSVPQLGTLARLSGAAAGAALLFWLLRNRTIVMPGAAMAACAAFVGWSLFSQLWSLNPSAAAHECGTLLQLALLYAIVAIVPATMRDVRAVFIAVVAGGLLAAAFGIHEFAHPTIKQQLLTEISDRIPLVLGEQRLDINQFADSLLLPLALVLVATVQATRLSLRIAGFAAIVVLVYAMSLAASREAFVAVGAMLAYFVISLKERRQIGLIAAALASLALANHNLWNRFVSASASGGSGRLGIWSAGLAAFRQHWLIGAGSGSFATAYDSVYLKVFQLYDMGWSRAAHNMLLQNGVEYGIVGLALLVAVVVFTWRSVSLTDRSTPLFGMAVAMRGAILALCIAGLFVDLTTTKVFWLALMLAALLRSCFATAQAAEPVLP
jgi:O-antigen ligase